MKQLDVDASPSASVLNVITIDLVIHVTAHIAESAWYFVL